MTESESAPVCQTCGHPESSYCHPQGRVYLDMLVYRDDGSVCNQHQFVPERAGDDEARWEAALPTERPDIIRAWEQHIAAQIAGRDAEHNAHCNLTDFARGFIAAPAPSGDEPVTSPDLDAARDFAERVGWRGDEVRAFIAGAVYREAISAPECAAAAERERGLRDAFDVFFKALAEDSECPMCYPTPMSDHDTDCPIGALRAAVSGEGEGQ